MTVARTVRENLGYALLGGPALAAVSFLAGAQFFGTIAGVGIGVVTYALGWMLSARRSRSGSTRAADADDDRDRREREADARKGGYGGSGGG
jgi:hypothetical protein